MQMTSCSSPEKKANDFILQLGDNGKVLATNLIGDDKGIVATIQPTDSTVAAIVYSLTTEKVDTIITLLNDEELFDAVKTENGYFVIIRQSGRFADLRHPYSAYYVGNKNNSKVRTVKKLIVDEDNEYLSCSGYVINKDEKFLTLLSDDADDNNVTVYQTVYDFNGNQVATDPISYDLKPIREAPAPQSKTTYVWECQHCGEKRNAAKEPSGWEFTCMRPGYAGGTSHKWVKIGRVD